MKQSILKIQGSIKVNLIQKDTLHKIKGGQSSTRRLKIKKSTAD